MNICVSLCNSSLQMLQYAQFTMRDPNVPPVQVLRAMFNAGSYLPSLEFARLRDGGIDKARFNVIWRIAVGAGDIAAADVDALVFHTADDRYFKHDGRAAGWGDGDNDDDWAVPSGLPADRMVAVAVRDAVGACVTKDDSGSLLYLPQPDQHRLEVAALRVAATTAPGA